MAKKALKKTYKFMHTIDGHPASFDRKAICFVDVVSPSTYFASALFNAKLVDSYSQIRRERVTTKKSCKEASLKYEPERYGYIKVELDCKERGK